MEVWEFGSVGKFLQRIMQAAAAEIWVGGNKLLV